MMNLRHYMHTMICNLFSKKYGSNSYEAVDQSEKSDLIDSNPNPYTYWSIFINMGLDGSIFNLMFVSYFTVFLIILELIIGITSIYSMNYVSEYFSKQMMSNNIDVHILFALFIVLFGNIIPTVVKFIFRQTFIKTKIDIIKKIQKTVHSKIVSAPIDVLNKYPINARFTAEYSFVWTYHTTTDYLIDIIVQFIRSAFFIIILVRNNFMILPIIIISYFILFYFVCPYLEKIRTQFEKNDENNHSEMRTASYYHYMYENEKILNPLLTKVDKIQDPVTPMVENIYSYMNKFKINDLQQMVFNVIQSTIIFIIIVFLIYSKNMSFAFVVIINRENIFGIVRIYSQLVQNEQRAIKDMEETTKILNDIDEINKNQNENITLLVSDDYCGTDCCETNSFSNIASIAFTNLVIPITNSYVITVPYGSIDFNKNQLMNNRVILLKGHSNCGKTVTINTLNGKYSGNRCDIFTVKYNNGTSSMNTNEFNTLQSIRCIIPQEQAELYTLNSNINQSIGNLFPFATIDEIKSILTLGFKIRDVNIPNDVNTKLNKNLSGGEKQRFSVASMIYKIKHAKYPPKFILFDEIDKALDKETAVHMIRWIINYLNFSTIFIVTHLTEVDNMLTNENFVQQTWTFSEPINNNIVVSIK